MHNKIFSVNSISKILFIIGFVILPIPVLKIYKNFTLSDFFFVCSFLILIIKRRLLFNCLNKIFTIHEFSIPIAFFLIGFLFSLSNAFFPIESITAMIQVLFIFVFIYPLMQLLVKTQKDFLYMINALFITLSILSGILFVFTVFTHSEYASLSFLLLEKGWGGGRISFAGEEPNVVARIVIQLIPLNLMYLIFSKKLHVKFINVLLLLINIYVALQTSSRSGLIVILLIFILTPFTLKKFNFNLNKIVLLSMTVFFISLFYLSNSLEFERKIGRFSTIFSVNKSESSIQRLSLLEQAMDHLKKNPIIGVGFANGVFHMLENIPPHNPIILTWFETGIFGLVGFFGIYVIFYYLIISSYKHSYYNNPLLWALSLIALSMIVGDMFMANSYKRFLWIPSMLFVMYYNFNSNNSTSMMNHYV